MKVLLTDGTVEGPYETQSIPRLYVIDDEGNIRYRKTGHGPDMTDRFLQELRWLLAEMRES